MGVDIRAQEVVTEYSMAVQRLEYLEFVNPILSSLITKPIIAFQLTLTIFLKASFLFDRS